MNVRRLRLRLDPESYAIARLPVGSPVPTWASGEGFIAVAFTADETTVVCPAGKVPPGVESNGPWVCFEVEGPLLFTEVGILADLAGVLAGAGISIFAVSTFSTDYILVPAAKLDQAVDSLDAAGHRVAGSRATDDAQFSRS